jgi:hypothetical protein
MFRRLTSRAVNSRIVKDQRFIGPKVIRITCQDHVICLFFFFESPGSPRQLRKLVCRGEFITLRPDKRDKSFGAYRINGQVSE